MTYSWSWRNTDSQGTSLDKANVQRSAGTRTTWPIENLDNANSARTTVTLDVNLADKNGNFYLNLVASNGCSVSSTCVAIVSQCKSTNLEFVGEQLEAPNRLNGITYLESLAFTTTSDCASSGELTGFTRQ